MTQSSPPITVHEGDIPSDLRLGPIVAVDTETMGLKTYRDRLCLVQLSSGDGTAHLVRIPKNHGGSPNLASLLADPSVVKLFHFARFDIAALQHYLGVAPSPVWCTKIASKLCRTYTDRHGLKDLCRELIGEDLSKQQQSSNWGADRLSQEQQQYAASDVLYLHRLKEALEAQLMQEGRLALAEACFNFLPTRAALDLYGWPDEDIFAH